MTTKRSVSTALENLLVNNDTFQYAHLVRFERPDGTYTYITDASRNVTYNGKTYLANKLLGVGTITESIRATPSNTTVVLDGNALGSFVQANGATITGSAGVFNIVFPSTTNLLDYGFREGDKITVQAGATTYEATILSFPATTTLRVSSSTLTTFSGTVSITLSSQEIISILMDKTQANYSSFVNRQVDIYKAYFDEGVLVGDPIYLFKGLIYSVSFEDSETSVKVSWGLTSQWGDFADVKGRITSDSFHRALDSSGNPQASAAIRPEYATDKGFEHSETSINMLTKYVVQSERQNIKTKKFLGIVTGVKVKTYYVPEDRFTDLNFNLQAKSIPVIYGVRTAEGIPIFADTLKDDSGRVYVAYAISEGEIGGIYDVYVNGKSLICSDKADSDARDQTLAAGRSDTSVEVLCRGRADRGDVLSGTIATGSTGAEIYEYDLPDGFRERIYGDYVQPSLAAQIYSTDSGGLGYDETLTLNSPQNISLIFYTGRSNQEACPLLTTLSTNEQFKIQTAYSASGSDYWSSNHKLLDTAYVVAEFKIADGETTIPELEYVIRGKYINCYNYDQSYEGISGNAANFNIGDTVTFSTGTSAMIIDKFKFKNEDGSDNYRFRWDTPPTVSGSMTFSMTKSGSTWTMGTYAQSGDTRVSINPALQLLDYMTSTRYGRGLSATSDIDLASWIIAARKCDKRSDVTIQLSSTAGMTLGSKYRLLTAGGALLFQGTVSEIKSGNYVTFNEVVGKLTNKWNSWKAWKVGEVLYTGNDNNLYVVQTAGVKSIEPTSSNAAGLGLTIVTSLTLNKVGGGTATTPTSIGNPVRDIRNGQVISGYSLYDCDSIDYWRLCGWDEHSQRYVTKYQTNLTVDTSASLFDNINGFLNHFNGILRYTSGLYSLDVEDIEPVIGPNDIRNITKDDIIGKIQLSDEGVRSSYNSLVASFADPAVKFEARNIGFFNSEFLASDKGVPKKGNLSVPGITNYYNTRLLAESYLNKSRFGLTVSMTLRYSGILLLAGTVIEITYPRYGWDNKPFRIDTVNMQPDGLVDIVAKEYDESFYLENRIDRSESIGPTGPTTRIVTIGPPSDLIVTSAETEDDLLDGVNLSWKNNPRAVPGSVVTELYGSRSPDLYIDVTSIATGSVLTCQAPHGLVAGMPIYPEVTYNNQLLAGTVYYVKQVLTSTQFTITTNNQSNILFTLATATGLNLKIRTASLLATVPVPGNTFFDNVPAEGTDKVEKYYWIRHKVTE
jgi:hypothetical protein